MEFRRCVVSEIIPVRHGVLRPGRPVETAHFDHDNDPETLHFGAFDSDGCAVACLTLLQSALPVAVADGVLSACASIGSSDYSASKANQGASQKGLVVPAWQLRGMATSEHVRGKGAGTKLMLFAVESARKEGFSNCFWCNAREIAVPFYRKNGWTVVSDVFDVPGIGPHYKMIFKLTE